MPSLSGLLMYRTISTGHSSRSSNAISSSSGRRFLAKSRSDFKLRFSVFFVIIGGASLFLSRSGFRFADLVCYIWQKLQDVGDNSNVCHLKKRSFVVLVDGDYEGIALNARQMLKRTADATCHVQLWLDGLPG